MRLTWVNNGFICKELYAPFVIEKDCDYYGDLKKRFNIMLKQAIDSGADETSIKIINKYKEKILEAVRCYYRADIAKSNTIILNLIKDIGENSFAVNTLQNSDAFPGVKSEELQFFRCRLGNPSVGYSAKDMLYLPLNMRAKSGNYRFSIPGNPSLYLSNSSYGCWIETGCPPENEFNVSPAILDGTQKILNLAVSIRLFFGLNEFEETKVHIWLKLLMLYIATSYRIKEEGRTFKSEYLVSQAVMMACKKLKYDGVAYSSKRVSDELFAFCAINLALFIDYDNEESGIASHMKMGDSFNYAMYKQLKSSMKRKSYNLRVVRTGIVTNIGNYYRQFPYSETEFFGFDKFLFSTWTDDITGRKKDDLPWGVL